MPLSALPLMASWWQSGAVFPPKDPERSVTIKADVVRWLRASFEAAEENYPKIDKQKAVKFLGHDATCRVKLKNHCWKTINDYTPDFLERQPVGIVLRVSTPPSGAPSTCRAWRSRVPQRRRRSLSVPESLGPSA